MLREDTLDASAIGGTNPKHPAYNRTAFQRGVRSCEDEVIALELVAL
jgi:hypothetical protein